IKRKNHLETLKELVKDIKTVEVLPTNSAIITSNNKIEKPGGFPAINLGAYPKIDESTTVIKDSSIIINKNGTIIAYLLKNIIPKEKVKNWTEKFQCIPVANTSRGDAAGPFDPDRMLPGFHQRTQVRPYEQISNTKIMDGNRERGNTLYTTGIGLNS